MAVVSGFVVLGDGAGIINFHFHQGAVGQLGLQGAHSFQQNGVGPQNAHQFSADAGHVDSIFHRSVEQVGDDLFGDSFATLSWASRVEAPR
jgi:hypothetical protein